MRKEEAETIGQLLEPYQFKTVINIGAGDVIKQKKNKPWIQQCIFNSLQDKGAEIVHTDIFSFDGIDVLADFTSAQVDQKFSTFDGPRLFLFNNVLEHIPSELVPKICSNINKCLSQGDALVVSVPFQYPFHADPIDTMFRPSPQDLAVLFSHKWCFTDVIEAGSYLEEIQKMHWSKAIRKLLKPFWFLQSPTRYRENMSRLKFLFQPYKITIVMTVSSD
jgi:hypothetical protein